MSSEHTAFFFYGTLRNPSWMRSFNGFSGPLSGPAITLPGLSGVAARGFTAATHEIKGWSLLRPNGLGFPLIRSLPGTGAASVRGTVAYISGPFLEDVTKWLDTVESEGSMYSRTQLEATPLLPEIGGPEEVTAYVPTRRFIESLAGYGDADLITSGDWLDRSIVEPLKYEEWSAP